MTHLNVPCACLVVYLLYCWWTSTPHHNNVENGWRSDHYLWDLDRTELRSSASVCYDVQLAKQIVQAEPRQVCEVDLQFIEEAIENQKVVLRCDYLEDPAIHVDFPILVIEGPTSPIVIDGWHRIAKAIHEGRTQLRAIFLNEVEGRQVQMRPDFGIVPFEEPTRSSRRNGTKHSRHTLETLKAVI